MSNEDSNEPDDLQSKINTSIETVKSSVIKSGKVIADKSKKAADSAAKFASEVGTKIGEKKEQVIEKRKKQKAEFIDSLKDDKKYKQIFNDEKLPPMVTIPATEHQQLLDEINALKIEVGRLEEDLETAEEIVQKLDQTSENKNDKATRKKKDVKEKGITGEVNKSINQILITLGFSVIWAIVLIAVTFQLEQSNINFSGLGAKAVVWPIGTAVWTMFLLTSQSKAGTLLSMDVRNRIKTSVGIGLATTLSLMLTDGETRAITNIWGWSMTVVLCAFLLSGFFRGIYSTLRKISNKMKI
tara:strand:- start:547 stop:1443 length:897 start_codon:yes stop_codon:yes gene_type:complete